MKILFYSDNLYPEISGISDSIIALGRELVVRGHEVAFVGPKYPKSAYSFIQKTKGAESPLDPFKVIHLPSISFGAAASGVARMAIPLGFSFPFIYKWKPDIIHTQTPFGTGIEALIASKLFRIPLIGTNHTKIDEFIKIYGPIRTDWAVRLVNWLFSLYYNRCSFVSAPASSVLDQMKENGLKRDCSPISNPISFDAFHPVSSAEKEDLRKELGLSGKVIIFSGRIALEKKIDVLIQGFEILLKDIPDVKLIIAGNGPVEEDLKLMVSEKGLSKSIIFTGFLDHVTLAKWYQASDVFAVMSPFETQSLSLMQAFATAIPSVGVKEGAVGLHIHKEFGYLVPLGDYNALADAIKKIFDHPEKSAAMGISSLEYVKNFSSESVAIVWENLYNRAIK